MAYIPLVELMKMGFRRIGRNVKVSDKASIYNPEKIELGDNSRIDDFCVISGLVSLGRNVHIAPHCLVAGGGKALFYLTSADWHTLYKFSHNLMITRG